MSIPVQSLISVTQSNNVTVINSLPFSPAHQDEDTIEIYLNDDIIDPSTYTWDGTIVNFVPPRILNGFTYIYLVVPINRLENFNQGSFFKVSDLNYQFDKLILLLQQVNSNNSIALKYDNALLPSFNDLNLPLLINNSYFVKVGSEIKSKVLNPLKITSTFNSKNTTFYFLNVLNVSPPDSYLYGSVLDYDSYNTTISIPAPLDGLVRTYDIGNKSQVGNAERLGTLYYSSYWQNTTKGNGIINFNITRNDTVTVPINTYYYLNSTQTIKAGNNTYFVQTLNLEQTLSNVASIKSPIIGYIEYSISFNVNSAPATIDVSLVKDSIIAKTYTINTSGGNKSITIKDRGDTLVLTNSVITVVLMSTNTDPVIYKNLSFSGTLISQSTL